MKQSELYNLLKKINIPIKYRLFSKKQNPPYGIYFRTAPDNIFADDSIFSKIQNYRLEIYNDVIDRKLEEKIEQLLSENEITYSKDEDYIEDEKKYIIYYDFTIQEE